MYRYGFIKVCAITPKLLVGNPNYNVSEILSSLEENKAAIAVFPELCITGYTCNDLFFQRTLLDEACGALKLLLEKNKFPGIVLVGCPLDIDGALFNTAIVIKKDKILGVIPKRFLPNTEEFYEKRWFKSGNDVNIKTISLLGDNVPFGNIIFEISNDLRFGVEICEDMWAPISPGNMLSVYGANLIINLSASNEVLGKDEIRRNAVLDHSRRNAGAYVYASAGVDESTSETVFSGHNLIATNGELICEAENFSINTKVLYADIDLSKINYKRLKNSSLRDALHKYPIDYQKVRVDLIESLDYRFEKEFDQTPFVPKKSINEDFNKIASLQEYGLIKRLTHINTRCVVIGISGGLDSTLALLIAKQAFKILNWDPKGIIAVTMPGLGTSERTKKNAIDLMTSLGVTILEKDIKESVKDHFRLIEHDENVKDLTYENAQARIRTLILMDLATKYNGFVLGTGDLSELALGWCTYNGDQMSMYGINAGLPKTMVRFMIENYAKEKYQDISKTLLDIVATPISPELIDDKQKTEDTIGKYEINDFIIYRFLSCGDTENRIKFLLQKAFNIDTITAEEYVIKFFKRFYSQQFKRQSLPDGPKVLDISISPRSDFRMPSDIKR